MTRMHFSIQSQKCTTMCDNFSPHNPKNSIFMQKSFFNLPPEDTVNDFTTCTKLQQTMCQEKVEFIPKLISTFVFIKSTIKCMCRVQSFASYSGRIAMQSNFVDELLCLF